MPQAARVSDMHTCPMQTPGTPPIPHVGGPILPPCSVNVITCMMPQARVGDMALCVGPPDTIAKGSATVMVNNMPAARVGDMTAHGGSIVVGAPTVIIGDAGGGGGGGGAAMAQSGIYQSPVAQAKALIEAAVEGKHFCARCAAAAAAGGAAPEAEAPGANILSRLYQRGRAMIGSPGGKLASAAYEVNPEDGNVNCGYIIDAVYARVSGADPKAVAQSTERDGSWKEIEQRFDTKLDQGKSFADAYDAVRQGGDGTAAVVKIIYGDGDAHVVIMANDKGAVGIVEGQGGGEFITAPGKADEAYNSDGKSTVRYGIVPKK